MHVAHNFLSLSIDLPENSGSVGLFATDVAIDGDTLNFAAMLDTNVIGDGLVGEALPVSGLCSRICRIATSTPTRK